MTDGDDKDVNFLKRWSGRKTALRERETIEQVEIRDQGEDIPAVERKESEVEELAAPDDLPDIETLNKDSDFSLFMREGTPEHLKKLALRKLFKSDPAFSVLDGLNDYDEDYSMIGMFTEAVSTRYKPGQGMVEPEEGKKSNEEIENIPNERNSELDTNQDQYSDQDNNDDLSEDIDPDNEMVEFDEENKIDP